MDSRTTFFAATSCHKMMTVMKVVMSLMMTVMMTVVTLGPELGSGSGQKPSVGRHSYCWYLSPSTLEFLYFALKFLLLVSSFMLLCWLLSASNLKRWFQIHFEVLVLFTCCACTACS